MRATRGTVLSSGSQEPDTERTNPFSTSTRPGRPTPIPATSLQRSSAEARARSISARSVSTTLPSPWVGSWAVARTLPSGHTSPADIVEAPTSTPITGVVDTVICAEAGKRCAIAEVQFGWSPSAGGMQGNLAGLESNARQNLIVDDRRGGKLTWRVPPVHVQGRHAPSDMVTTSVRQPAASACAFMVPGCHDSLRGQHAEIKGESTGGFPPTQAQLASTRHELVEILRALGGHATCSAIRPERSSTS